MMGTGTRVNPGQVDNENILTSFFLNLHITIIITTIPFVARPRTIGTDTSTSTKLVLAVPPIQLGPLL